MDRFGDPRGQLRGAASVTSALFDVAPDERQRLSRPLPCRLNWIHLDPEGEASEA